MVYTFFQVSAAFVSIQMWCDTWPGVAVLGSLYMFRVLSARGLMPFYYDPVFLYIRYFHSDLERCQVAVYLQKARQRFIALDFCPFSVRTKQLGNRNYSMQYTWRDMGLGMMRQASGFVRGVFRSYPNNKQALSITNAHVPKIGGREIESQSWYSFHLGMPRCDGEGEFLLYSAHWRDILWSTTINFGSLGGNKIEHCVFFLYRWIGTDDWLSQCHKKKIIYF